MAPDSQTRKISLFLIGFTLLLTTVSAAEPEIDIDPNDEVIWSGSEDHTLNANVKCSGSVNSVKLQDSTQIFSPFGEESYENNSSVNYNYSFNDVTSNLGSYEVIAECEDGNISREELVLDEMDIELKSPLRNEKWYVGVDETVKVSLSSEKNSFSPENLRLVNISVNNQEVRDKTEGFASNMDIGIRGNKLEGILDKDENKDDVNLKITSYYDSAGDVVKLSQEETIQLGKWRVANVEVSPDTKLTSSEFSQLSLNADVEYKGTPINKLNDSFGPDNFYLKGYSDEDRSKWFNGDLVDASKGRYSLSLGPSPQNLKRNIGVVFKSEFGANQAVTVAEIRIEDVNEYIWSPKVLTSGQSAVEADFKLYYDDGSYENFTSTNGDFSEKIWPGNHDLDVTFPQAKLTLSEVELDEDNSGRNILYDYYFYNNIGDISSSSEIMEGIKPVNLLYVNFAYPFEKASIDMRYNNEQIDRSEDMKVYECTRWHAEDGECKSDEGWEQLNSNDVRTVPASWKSTKYSTAKFSVTPYRSTDNGDILQNAYVVGTSADLVLNGGLSISGPEGGTVATGSEIEVSGNINSENENAVEGADVEVSFYQGDTEISSFDTVETDVTGRFVATGKAPEEPGNYSVRITADKENYNLMEKKFDNRFETVIEEGIAVRTGSTVEVSPGEDVTAEITVRNTGQTDMEDVSLSFEGLDSQYYSVSEASFEEVAAGEERTTEVTVSLPSDYCDGGCGDWPSLEVSATASNTDGEEFEADAETLQVQISRTTSGQNDSEEPGQETSETDDTNDGSGFADSVSDLENATGEFLASQSSLNLALGLIMVFMMVLAGAVKKQNNGDVSRGAPSRDGRDGRGGRPRVQKPNVGGSSVEQAEDQESQQEGDEVDSVLEQIESDHHDVDSQIDAIAGSVVGEEQDDTAVVEVDDKHQSSDESDYDTGEIEPESEDGKFVCEETGEAFDTKAALKLHRQINGLDN